jgi:hypothetical protein
MHRSAGAAPLLRERDCVQPDSDYEFQLRGGSRLSGRTGVAILHWHLDH